MAGDDRVPPPPYPSYPQQPQQQQGAWTPEGNPAPGPQPNPPQAPGGAPYPPYSGGYPQGSVSYGPGPQSGWTPNPQEAARYGQIGRVPWTLAQTVIGTLLTIVPWLVIIVGSQIITSAGSVSSPSTGRLPVGVDLIGGIVALVFTVVVEGAFLIAPLVVALARRPQGTTRRDGLRALGFRKAPFWPSVGWIAGGLFTVYFLGFIYSLLIQGLNLNLQTNAEALQKTAQYAPITTILTLAGAVFVAPFCEETFFRGYLFAGLLRGIGPWVAGLIATVLFTLVHGDIGSAFLLFAIGLILAAMRFRLGSIWPGIVLHALNNGVAAIFIVAAILGSAPAR
jgi:membrane protease YdiL (CAAX protease family)